MSRTVVKLAAYFSYNSAQGALTTLWAATSPETAHANGKYLIPWARFGQAHANATKPEFGEKLWNWLQEQTKEV
jgi:retinol dehydrogenase 12